MKLYNTLTRQRETLVPLRNGAIGMYVCGPTVYNLIHIGNARPLVVFDTVRRYLLFKGFDVNYVQNFTDVDDKIIKAANAESVDSTVISERYIAEFFKDAQGLNLLQATHHPKVTEEMDGIIKMIQTLIAKDAAYEIDGTVYFNAAAVRDYGKLSKKNVDDLEAGARVEYDTNKRSTTDFVLWKPAKPGEPKWVSPWGEGRPGWHIECSVMAKKYLGDTIDIHAGGEDLIFPHHENEIAQSEAANGAPFAKYWLHNGMINVDHQKMSKSKGNFFMLREVAEQFGYEVVRFYILSVHYRSPINFSAELLQAAQNGLERIRNCARTLTAHMATSDALTQAETALLSEAEGFRQQFTDAMDDDFNTANAVTAIFELVKFANTHVFSGASKAFASALRELLFALCDVLGLRLESDAPSGVDEAAVLALLEKRAEARATKNWAESDRIRDLLNEMNIVVKDTPDGVKWHVKGN